MMLEKDQDLGLSLSLSFRTAENNLNLIKSSSSHNSPFHIITKTSWADAFHLPSSDERRRCGPQVEACTTGESETRPFLKGIDVNRLPPVGAEEDEEEEGGVSSPNSTISSVSTGKRSERELGAISIMVDDDQEMDQRACSGRGISDEEDAENSRKKLRLSKDQSAVLEQSFNEHSTLNPKQKLALAKRLRLRPRQVEVWFQNRRARTKLKQTEVDCEFLKRCCENLTEENRRLQKEVQELRALKLSPQLYMQMNPPTTLTMCPSCERVGAPSAPSSAVPSAAPVATRSLRIASSQTRPITIGSWAATSIPHQSFEALHRLL